MNITFLKVLSFVWSVWPTVAKVVPMVVRAVQAVADHDLSGASKKDAVVSAVRAAVPVELVPDALLNWLIETVLQVLRRKGGGK